MTIYFTYSIDPDVYYDTEGLTGTIQANMPIAISNAESVTLWFKAELVSPPADYISYSQHLGSLAASISGYFIFTFTRNMPTLTDGELDEALTIRVTAYTDSGYSVLYGHADSLATIHFFNSYDPAWTMLYHDTFDDGTVQSWVAGDETVYPLIDLGYWSTAQCAVCDFAFLSAPYCLGITHFYNPPYSTPRCAKKTFTVTGTRARIVLHIKWEGGYSKFAVKIGNTLYIPAVIGALLPTSKWIRLTFPIPIGTTTVYLTQNGSVWGLIMDEVRVISK
jgi:hypothetical protein